MVKKVFLIAFFSALAFISKGQASWEQFGQNRVQYRTFEWKYFDSVHFRTFYYDYGKANAMYAISLAEQELSHIVYMMGGRLNKKLNIILYNSFGDYRQTNLGRKNDDLNAANGGKVDVAGDYIAVYFNGDHENLRKQLRSGIAKVIKDNMLFGDNLKDVVKNAVQMNLPEWYTLGYVSFIAEEWSGEKQADITNLILLKEKKKFTDLATTNPSSLGHSFWHFVSEKYGENYISNLLYLTRYRKSVNNAIEIVFKKPANELYKEWEVFYSPSTVSESGSDSLAGRTLYTSIPTKTDAQYSQIVASPSGREIAYVEKRDGQFKIFIRDVKYNKSYVIIEGGVRAMEELADPDYPMLCWSPSGNKMAALYHRKNILNLRIFTTGKRIMEKRSVSRTKLDRITGMCFMGDENTLAITGIKKGQSDLFKLTIKNNRLEAITNDLFDDKEPRYVENGASSGILFLSNRTSRFTNEDTKSDKFNPHFNLFLYEATNGTNLTRLSQAQGKILSPMQWGLEEFSYLEDKNGKLERKIVTIERSGIAPDTFSIRNSPPTPFTILRQEYIQKSARVAEVTKQKKNYTIYNTPFSLLHELDENYQKSLAEKKDTTLPEELAEVKTGPSEYITPFDNETDSSVFLANIFSNTQKNNSKYQTFEKASNVAKAKQYKTTFYPDFIQTSLDNTLLFTRYQPIDQQFNNVPLSGFLTSTLTDVMEDYKITGGARLGVDLRSLDYFLQYTNYRRRADWGLLYFHTNKTEQVLAPEPFYSPFLVLGKRGMDYFQTNMSYPLDMLKSIRLQLGVRYDRTRYLAQDQYSIIIPNTKQFWLVSRAEYVYDNTINPMLNIWKGSRAKVFLEYQYKFNGDTKGFTNFGYDARNYLTLYKNLILASRFAGAHSLGNAKILYFLGGVDNPILSKFDGNTAVDGSDYAFQTLATNLRGYKQGARNGSSYMVINEEVRLPIYNTFFKRPIKSGFVRNLQLIAFADAGITMKGVFPTSENIINKIEIRDDQSNVTVMLERSGALGYGLGVRSRFLGYFIRADVAWNVEGSRKPMLHLSLATDF